MPSGKACRWNFGQRRTLLIVCRALLCAVLKLAVSQVSAESLYAGDDDICVKLPHDQ